MSGPVSGPVGGPVEPGGMGLSWVPVLGAAALVTSPAIWHAVQGVTPASVALTRFLVALVLCRLALGVVAVCVGPAPRPRAEPDPANPDSSAVASQPQAG